MTPTAIDILILLFGCALFMGILIFALTYREIKLKKLTAEQDTKDFVAMRLHKEHLNAEREHKTDKPDRTLTDMRNIFSELQKSQVKTDPNEPEFGQGWFYYIVQRDIAELERERGLKNNDKTS